MLSVLLGILSVILLSVISTYAKTSRQFNPEEVRKTFRGIEYYYECSHPRNLIATDDSRYPLNLQDWQVSIASRCQAEFLLRVYHSDHRGSPESDRKVTSGDVAFDRQVIVERGDPVFVRELGVSEELRIAILRVISLGVSYLISLPFSRLTALKKGFSSDQVLLPRQKTLDAIVDCLTTIESCLFDIEFRTLQGNPETD